MAAPSWEFHSIAIDFEVFKGLTARLESPTDTYNDVLRRLLGLRAEPANAIAANSRASLTFPRLRRRRLRW